MTIAAVLATQRASRARRRARVRAALGGAARSRQVQLPARNDVAVVLGSAAAGWFVLALPGALIAAAGAVAMLRVRARRVDRVPGILAQERFADALASIAAAVRAGTSLPQALGYAAGEAEPPARAGLEQIVGDLDVGVPIEQALERWRTSLAEPGHRPCGGCP